MVSEYIKKLLKDKARLKKWKKITLALSCVVVFCVVYALTLPAITLEGKTICGMEEHTHTEECYQDDKLICDKEEHQHTEDCYEKEEEQPVEEENTQPDTTEPSDEVETVENQDDGTSSKELDTGNGEETTTKTPFVLNSTDRIDSVTVTDNKNNPGISNGTLTPDSRYLKITVNFKNINASELKNTYGGSFSYKLPDFFRMIDTTDRPITDSSNNQIGTIHVENGKAIVTYTDEFFNSLVENATLDGSFFVEGEINLNELNKDDGTIKYTKPDGDITLNYGQDYLEKFGDVKVEKKVSKNNNNDYIQYSITVTAGKDGSKNVYVVDQFTNNGQLVSYMGNISNKPMALEASSNGQNPYETKTTSVAGKVYLTNQPISENEIPTEVENVSSIKQPGSLVWSIDTLAPNESRTLTYFVKLSDNQRLNGQPITNKATAFTKKGETTYSKGQFEKTFTPNATYTMPKSVVETNGKKYTKDKEGNYIIQYKLEFNLNSPSNYPLKNFVFMDYLNYGDIYTDNKMLPYISYDKDSVELHRIKNDKDETVAKSK